MADVNRSKQGQDRDRDRDQGQRRDISNTPDRMAGREAGSQDDLGVRPHEGGGPRRQTDESSRSGSGSSDDDTIRFVPDSGSE
jgi:hypothetical protein